MITRTFGSFAFDEVEEMFNIQEVKQLPLLSEWLSASPVANDKIDFILDKFSAHLLQKAHIWQEDELKMFFIGPLIEMAEIGTEVFQAFTQRFFSIKFQNEEIGGKVDFMIAKGRKNPKQPYFCIHEYKQEANTSDDALGQLLIAMVAAQSLNEIKHPILGAYVIGRYWFFVTLEDNKYAKSISYDASSNDIFQIFAILQKSKEIITRYI